MKKLISIIFSFVIISLSLNVAFAHPGSLDSNGGHWNHSTGEYHYHDGDNDDGNSSGGSEHTYGYNYDYNYTKSSASTKKDNKKSLDSNTIVFIIIACLILFFIILKSISFLSDYIRKCKKNLIVIQDAYKTSFIIGEDVTKGKHIVSPIPPNLGEIIFVKNNIIVKRLAIENEQKIKFKKGENIILYNCKIKGMEAVNKTDTKEQKQLATSPGNESKEEFIKKYSGVPISSVIDVPSAIKHIDYHGNITYSNEKKYGDYTVYTANGKTIHLKKGCSKANLEIDFLLLSPTEKEARCRRCFTSVPQALYNDGWLSPYRKIVLRKIEYNIDETPVFFNNAKYFSYSERQYIDMQKKKVQKSNQNNITQQNENYIVGIDLPSSRTCFSPDNPYYPAFVRVYGQKDKFYDYIIYKNGQPLFLNHSVKIELINCSLDWGD